MSSPTGMETFLAPYPPEVRDVALAAREFLRQALPGAAEELDESAKLFGYGYGPGYKGLVCTLLLSRTGVKLGIARGSELPVLSVISRTLMPRGPVTAPQQLEFPWR